MFCCKFLQQILPAPIKIYLCSKKEPGSFPALFYALLLILFFTVLFTVFANIFATAQQRGSTTLQKAQAARQLRKTVAKDGCLKRMQKAGAQFIFKAVCGFSPHYSSAGATFGLSPSAASTALVCPHETSQFAKSLYPSFVITDSGWN